MGLTIAGLLNLIEWVFGIRIAVLEIDFGVVIRNVGISRVVTIGNFVCLELFMPIVVTGGYLLSDGCSQQTLCSTRYCKQ